MLDELCADLYLADGEVGRACGLDAIVTLDLQTFIELVRAAATRGAAARRFEPLPGYWRPRRRRTSSTRTAMTLIGESTSVPSVP